MKMQEGKTRLRLRFDRRFLFYWVVSLYPKATIHMSIVRKEVNTMATVTLRSNESQDQLLKRFRKKVAKSGILSTVRRKRWFVSKSELRRIDKKKSIRRLKRRQTTDME
jgi:small subunit ribosomal protein S21